jgi:integrase
MTMLTDYADAPGYGMPYAPKPWKQFEKEVLALYKPPHRAKATYRGMFYAFRLLNELGKEIEVEDGPSLIVPLESTADLTVPLIGRFVASRPATLSPNSVRGALRCIQALCSYAQQMGYLRVSPFAIRKIGAFVKPVPPAGIQYASREDIRKVLDHMWSKTSAGGWEGWKARRVHALTATLSFSGVRYSEALWLHAADIDRSAGTIAIVSRASHRLKTAGAHAVIPLHPELDPILASWLEHRMSVPPGFEPIDPNCPFLFPTLRRHGHAPGTSGGPGQRPSVRIKTLAAEVGVRLTPLMARHSFATHLASSGAGPKVLQFWLRHTNTQTQRFYVHADLDAMRQAGSRVTY